MSISKKLEELGQKWKRYREEAPERRRERHANKMERLKMKNEEKTLQMQIQKKNHEMYKQRSERQLANMELMERKSKAMKEMPKIGI